MFSLIAILTVFICAAPLCFALGFGFYVWGFSIAASWAIGLSVFIVVCSLIAWRLILANSRQAAHVG